MALDSVHKKRNLDESRFGYEGIKKETYAPSAYQSMQEEIAAIQAVLGNMNLYTIDDIRKKIADCLNKIKIIEERENIDLSNLRNNMTEGLARIEIANRTKPDDIDKYYDIAAELSRLCLSSANNFVGYSKSIIQQKEDYKGLIPDIIDEIKEIDFGDNSEALISMYQNGLTTFLGISTQKYEVSDVERDLKISEMMRSIVDKFVIANDIITEFTSLGISDSEFTSVLSTVKNGLSESLLSGKDIEKEKYQELLDSIKQKYGITSKDQSDELLLSEISKTF